MTLLSSSTPIFILSLSSFVSSEFLLNLPFPPHSLWQDSCPVTHYITPELLWQPRILFPVSCLSLPVNTASYFLLFSVTQSKTDLLCSDPLPPYQGLSHMISWNTPLAPDRSASSSPLALSVRFSLPGVPWFFILHWNPSIPSSLTAGLSSPRRRLDYHCPRRCVTFPHSSFVSYWNRKLFEETERKYLQGMVTKSKSFFQLTNIYEHLPCVLGYAQGSSNKPHSVETSYTVYKQTNTGWSTEFEETRSDSLSEDKWKEEGDFRKQGLNETIIVGQRHLMDSWSK